MACTQPERKKSFFNFLLRFGLVAANSIFVYWRIKRVYSTINQAENDGRIYSESANLTVMVVELVLNIMFILAAHIKNMKLLKVSLIGNIVAVTVFTVYSLCMFYYYSCSLYFQYKVSVKWMFLKPLVEKLGVVTSGASIEILISYAMILLCNEIKELETNKYLFRFVNTAAEAKCTMECEEQNKITSKKERNDTLQNKEVNTEETEDMIIGEAREGGLNNIIVTKCTIEYEDREMDNE